MLAKERKRGMETKWGKMEQKQRKMEENQGRVLFFDSEDTALSALMSKMLEKLRAMGHT